LLGGSDTIRSTVTTNLAQDLAGVNLDDICSAQVNPLISPEAFEGLWRRIDQSGGLGLRGILESVSQIPRETRALQAQITQAIASRAWLALDRLGPIPSDELSRNASFDIDLSKAFRNGMTIGGAFTAQSRERQYVDKPLDPTFGAFDIPAQFRSSTSLTVNVPLARGRGAVSTAAPERVSNALLRGQREQVRHDVSEEVFRTVLSYLNLIAAQDTLALLEESAARQQRLLELSEQQVNSGDLARVELGRVQARAASVGASVAKARAAVQSARVALAEAIGVDVDSLAGAPIATETFATVPAAATPAVVPLDRALAARRDARAAEERRSAAAALTAGAEADRKPRLDFSWSAGFTNLYESPFFKFLPDEAGPVINNNSAVPIPSLTGSSLPPLSPVRYFSPRGYARVLSGRYEPFFTIGVTIQLPFGNHAAEGRALQARATLESRTINAVDLRRVIGENIVSVGNSVQRTAAAVAAWQDAVTNGDRTLEGALQRFQTGDLTLIDTLLTEEELTFDKLQLLRQRQTYFSAVARLKFEAGDLVVFDQEGLPSEVVRFLPATFVAR
jgi:outer membrane protein TolC